MRGRKRKLHFLKLYSSSRGTDQQGACRASPEGDPKNKVLSVLMREVPQQNGADAVAYGVVPLI